MQKRIFSLLLVLYMLLPMIPVGMVSAVAADAALPSSTLNLEAVTLPESGGKVTLPAGWSFVAHGAQQHPNTSAPHNGYETTYVLDTYVPGGIFCTLTAAENGTGKDFAASWSDGTTDGLNGIDITRLPVICFNGTESAHINMGINACVVYSGGYAYKAPLSGYITIDLANIATGGGTTGVGWGGEGETLVALFVGGEMVWPENGTYDDRSTWYSLAGNGGQNKTDLVNNGKTVENVYVAAGQSVEFLVFHSWWSNPVKADMTVTYTTIQSPRSVFHRDDAAIDANNKLILPSGWEAVGRAAGNYTNKVSITTLYNRDDGSNAVVGPGNEGGWIISEQLGWNTSPRLNWTGQYDRGDYHGPWMGIGTTSAWNAGYAYTAEYTGYVDISIDALRYFDLGYDNKSVAIFVDGNMIWPTAGGSYTDANAWMPANQVISEVHEWLYHDSQVMGACGEVIYGDLLKNIYIEKGQTIEFLARGGGLPNAVQADLTITYTSLGQAPTAVTAEVALGDTFAVTFTPSTGYGLYINGVQYDENTVATLTGIAAKDLTKEITYATYQVVGGVETKSATKVTSVMEILAQYTEANGYDATTVALAQAARRYAYAAAAYFDSNITVPASMLAAIDALAVPTGKNAAVTNSISETATFRGINLFIDDPMDIKVFFALDKAPTGTLTLKVEGAVSGTATAVEQVTDEYVFTVENIPMKNYGSPLKITLYDGTTQISETLTYGVEIYAARMYAEYGASEVAFGRLLKTIADLGQKAAAYDAAHA